MEGLGVWMSKQPVLALAVILFAASFSSALIADDEHGESVLSDVAVTTPLVANTVPKNGDVNPYGVAFIPEGFPHGGPLETGDILVSNFNDSGNLQGAGTTIVSIHPNGSQTLFFAGSPGLGLSTALGVLRAGFVLVGNVPTPDGMFDKIQQGSLLVLDSHGKIVTTLTSATLLDGPWDLAVDDDGAQSHVFVSNVLSGTVTRLDVQTSGGHFHVQQMTQIASGYAHRGDPAALAIGPTGLAFDEHSDTLYVASTGNNAIYAIHDSSDITHDQGTGKLIFTDAAHLRGPLGLALAPNGHLLATNGDAINPDPKNVQVSELVEFTASGHFIAQFPVDASAPGGAFGIALTGTEDRLILAAVDDVTNQLKVWTLR
jgi:DNA-binding beta-propeller fold protein YncE